MATRLADQFGNMVLAMAEAIDQRLIAFGLLDRVQVLALDILDQGQLGAAAVVMVADQRRDAVQPRSAPSFTSCRRWSAKTANRRAPSLH